MERTALVNRITSPGDLKNLGVDASDPNKLKEQIKQALQNVVKGRRRDNFKLKLKAVVSADDKNVQFGNANDFSSLVTSAAGVAQSTSGKGTYAQFLAEAARNPLVVRGLTITVSDETLWEKSWKITDGDFHKETDEEFNSFLDDSKSLITDDPKTRIVPIDFLFDGGFGLYIADVDGGTTAQTITVSLNVVAVLRNR